MGSIPTSHTGGGSEGAANMSQAFATFAPALEACLSRQRDAILECARDGTAAEDATQRVLANISIAVTAALEEVQTTATETARHQLQAQASVFNFKLATSRTAADVKLQTTMIEVQAVAAKKHEEMMLQMNSGHTTQVDELMAILATAREDLTKAQDQLKTTTTMYETANAACQAAEAERDAKEMERAALEVECDDARDEANGAKEGLDRLRAENETLSERIATSSTALEQAHNETRVLVQECDELRRELAGYDQKAAAERDTLESELQSAKAELMKAKQGLEAIGRVNNAEICAAREEAAQLREEISAAKEALQEALASLEVERGEARTLKEQIRELVDNFNRMQRKCAEAKAVISDLNTAKLQNESLNHHLRELTSRFEAVSRELAQLREDQHEVVAIRAEVNATTLRLREALEEVGGLTDENQSLSEHVNELVQKYQQSYAALNKANALVDELSWRLEGAAREIASTRAHAEERVNQVRSEEELKRASLTASALKALSSLSAHLKHTLAGLRSPTGMSGMDPIVGLRRAQLKSLQSVYPPLKNLIPAEIKHKGLPLPSVGVSTLGSTSPRTPRAYTASSPVRSPRSSPRSRSMASQLLGSYAIR